jgi:hypothetical protein
LLILAPLGEVSKKETIGGWIQQCYLRGPSLWPWSSFATSCNVSNEGCGECHKEASRVRYEWRLGFGEKDDANKIWEALVGEESFPIGAPNQHKKETSFGSSTQSYVNLSGK